MQPSTVLLLMLMMLVYGCIRSPGKTRHAWQQQLGGWQKVFGAIAVILALLILLNPDFLALGLLGDTTFFDMLVLALALQMHVYASQVARTCLTAGAKAVRFFGIPSPGLRYLLAVTSPLLKRALIIIRKPGLTQTLSQV